VGVPLGLAVGTAGLITGWQLFLWSVTN